jgi:NlpC/P60 family
MTSRLRLVPLVVVLSWSIAVGPVGVAAAAEPNRADSPWFADRLLDTPRFRAHGLIHASSTDGPSPKIGLGARAANYARHLLGVPYRYGGESPASGFDCSGLVRYVFAHFGLELPHSSYADFDLGASVDRGSLRPGDLVFFDGVGHVGLYVGSGLFIHAPHSGMTVRFASLNDPWYRSSYVGARRVFRSTTVHVLAATRRTAQTRTPRSRRALSRSPR